MSTDMNSIHSSNSIQSNYDNFSKNTTDMVPLKPQDAKTNVVKHQIIGGNEGVKSKAQFVSQKAFKAYRMAIPNNSQPKTSFIKELVSLVINYIKGKFTSSPAKPASNTEISRPEPEEVKTSNLEKDLKIQLLRVEHNIYHPERKASLNPNLPTTTSALKEALSEFVSITFNNVTKTTNHLTEARKQLETVKQHFKDNPGKAPQGLNPRYPQQVATLEIYIKNLEKMVFQNPGAFPEESSTMINTRNEEFKNFKEAISSQKKELAEITEYIKQNHDNLDARTNQNLILKKEELEGQIAQNYEIFNEILAELDVLNQTLPKLPIIGGLRDSDIERSEVYSTKEELEFSAIPKDNTELESLQNQVAALSQKIESHTELMDAVINDDIETAITLGLEKDDFIKAREGLFAKLDELNAANKDHTHEIHILSSLIPLQKQRLETVEKLIPELEARMKNPALTKESDAMDLEEAKNTRDMLILEIPINEARLKELY
ncbi:MAG: hypothetical protein H0V82_12345 [Candidatus Protochlamydia sp.]|nr:hypothetical protein [Candidatus Protochlamydia sp.]